MYPTLLNELLPESLILSARTLKWEQEMQKAASIPGLFFIHSGRVNIFLPELFFWNPYSSTKYY